MGTIIVKFVKKRSSVELEIIKEAHEAFKNFNYFFIHVVIKLTIYLILIFNIVCFFFHFLSFQTLFLSLLIISNAFRGLTKNKTYNNTISFIIISAKLLRKMLFFMVRLCLIKSSPMKNWNFWKDGLMNPSKNYIFIKKYSNSIPYFSTISRFKLWLLPSEKYKFSLILWIVVSAENFTDF